MTYITGTLATANASLDLYNLVAPGLTANGYTLVDTVVIGATTYKVWENPAANNATGLKWFLALRYNTTGSGTLYATVMEDYDPATDLATRMVLSGTSSYTIENTFWSRSGATQYAFENVNWSNATGVPSGNCRILTSSSSFGYWISVTNNRIIMMSSLEPTSIYYAGSFEESSFITVIPAGERFPICTAALASSGTNSIYLTRYPRQSTASKSSSDRVGMMNAGTLIQSVLNVPNEMLPSPSTLGGMNPLAWRMPITTGAGTLNNSPGNQIYGALRDVAWVTTTSTITRGDTVTIGGDQWTLATAGGSAGAYFAAVMFKAA